MFFSKSSACHIFANGNAGLQIFAEAAVLLVGGKQDDIFAFGEVNGQDDSLSRTKGRWLEPALLHCHKQLRA
jgi:hypothetical protein